MNNKYLYLHNKKAAIESDFDVPVEIRFAGDGYRIGSILTFLILKYQTISKTLSTAVYRLRFGYSHSDVCLYPGLDKDFVVCPPPTADSIYRMRTDKVEYLIANIVTCLGLQNCTRGTLP